MERLVRSCYKKKSGYVFARKAEDIAREYGIDRIARLASNENPEPLSPGAREAAQQALLTVNRYPDERVNILMNALRGYYGDYHFVTGVGMDGVIETTIRTLVEPGEKVVISTPTFSFYALSAMGQGAEVVTVPRKADFSVDPGIPDQSGTGRKDHGALFSQQSHRAMQAALRLSVKSWKVSGGCSSLTMPMWSSRSMITSR